MQIKGLSRQQVIYLIGGATLLVALVLAIIGFTSTRSGGLIIDPSRYDLTDPSNKQQFDNLVAAHDKLKSGFNFDAANQQASALLSLQDYKQAEVAWKYFIANRPGAIQGYWGLGEIYTHEGLYDKAEANWLHAIGIDTTAGYANSFIKLADLYKGHFPEKRYKLVQILTAAMQKNPTEANYPLLLAQYYQDIGDNQSAIRFYTQVLQLQPNAPTAPAIRETINALKSTK